MITEFEIGTHNNNNIDNYFTSAKPKQILSDFLTYLINKGIFNCNNKFYLDIIKYASNAENTNLLKNVLNLLLYSINIFDSNELFEIFLNDKLNKSGILISNENISSLINIFPEEYFKQNINKCLDLIIKINQFLMTSVDQFLFKLLCNWIKLFYEKLLSGKSVIKHIKELESRSEYNMLYLIFSNFMFFTKFEYILISIDLIEYLISTSYKTLMNKSDKSLFFFEMFTIDYFNELVEIGKSKNTNFNYNFNFKGNVENKQLRPSQIIEHLLDIDQSNITNKILFTRDLCLLYFIFQYKINFTIFKDNYLSLIEKRSMNAQSIDYFQDKFKHLSYFQCCYYSNFFLLEIYEFLTTTMDTIDNISEKNNQTIYIKLENVILNYISNIGKYFTSSELTSFNEKSSLSQPFEFLHYTTKIEFEEHIKKSMIIAGTGNGILKRLNYSEWESLFNKNPYHTTLFTMSIFSEEGKIDKIFSIKFNY
jgi:hypothetical protein